MKCNKCGKFLVKIGQRKTYCKICNLLYYELIPGMPPQVFKMSEKALAGQV